MAAYGLPQCLRISIGLEAENRAVVEALARVRDVTGAGKPPRFERVALIGIGLINGSLALNLRAAGIAGEIVACARTEATLEKARALGLADRTTTRPERRGRRAASWS